MRVMWAPCPYWVYSRVLVDAAGIIRRPMKDWKVPLYERLPQVVDYRISLTGYDESLMGKAWHCHDDSVKGEPVQGFSSLGIPKEQSAQTDYDKRLASWLSLLGLEKK